VLAFLNVTTGVFVEASLKNATADRDDFMINNVRELFKDASDSTKMTWDSFVGQLGTPEMRAYFNAIDLDPSEARGLFRLLDIDDSGTINAEEFLNGALRLRGPAKALDLALVMRETRRMHCQFNAHLLTVEKHLLEASGGMCSSSAVPLTCGITPASVFPIGSAGKPSMQDSHPMLLGSFAGMMEMEDLKSERTRSLAETSSDSSNGAYIP